MSESTHKAIDLLFALGKEDGASLTELSKALDWDKATTSRYLAALGSRGLAERHGDSWTLGLALLELAAMVPVRESVAAKAMSFLQSLAAATGETVNLSAYDGGEVTYLAKAEGCRNLRLRSSPGDKLPLYCSAAGKCALASLPDDELGRILESIAHTRYTPYTILDSETLRKELISIRERGWAIDNEELEHGLVCVGVPLVVAKLGFIGAISVSGPSGRMTEAREFILDEIRSAISGLLALLNGGRDD